MESAANDTQQTPKHTRVLIIGGGPAGYTAAIYAARALLEPVVMAGVQPGGQLTITTDVENYPGFAETIQGPWLMEQMLAQARHAGARVVSDLVTSVDFSQRPFSIELSSGERWTCDTVIAATGAQARWLGLPSEETFRGFGVSACATCDGFFYRNKPVLVVGGGNTAGEEALYLSHIAKSVTLIHRGNRFRAEQVLQAKLRARPNVEIIWDTVIEEVTGKSGFPPSATGANLLNRVTGERSSIAADGIFIAIGHSPAVELFAGQLRMGDNGYIWTDAKSTRTNVPGVFAAGDVTDDVFRQAVTAAGQGCMAALEAERYLFDLQDTPLLETA